MSVSEVMSNVQRSESLDQLATALAAAQAEFGAIPKTETNPFFKNRYADLAAVIGTASPIVTKHGLSVAQFLGCDEQGNDTLTTWLLHKSGQFIAQTMRLHLSKQDAQGHGSATTYGRRYAYMAALSLVADEDDDGERAAARQQIGAKRSDGREFQPLSDATVDMLVQSITAARPTDDQLRSWMIAAGAQDVPERVRVKSVLKGLSQEQAAFVLAECHKLADTVQEAVAE